MKVILFVVVASLALVVPVQAEVLINGDFNTGDFTGWWTWVDDPCNSYVQIEPGSGYNYDGTDNALLSSYNTAWPAGGPVAVGQTFDLTGDQAYNVSFVYSTQWTDWGTADYLIKYYDDTWAEIGNEWATLFYQEAGPTDWVPVSLDFTTPSSTAHVDVQFRVYDWADAVYFDNVSVVPEPATLALFGLGGLLLRRRRKA